MAEHAEEPKQELRSVVALTKEIVAAYVTRNAVDMLILAT